MKYQMILIDVMLCLFNTRKQSVDNLGLSVQFIGNSQNVVHPCGIRILKPILIRRLLRQYLQTDGRELFDFLLLQNFRLHDKHQVLTVYFALSNWFSTKPFHLPILHPKIFNHFLFFESMIVLHVQLNYDFSVKSIIETLLIHLTNHYY
jgi:hypothetical protein